MAGLTRKTSVQFGNAGPTSAFGQFGSKEAGVPQTSQDPAVIQGLPARWQQGWQSAVVAGSKAAYIEDMNGFCFVDSYQLTYLFQMGIPEWDSATLYFTGSVVHVASSGQEFKSLQGGVPGAGAGQSGNTPPVGASNAFWLWTNPPQDLVGTATLNTIPKITNTAPANGVPGSVTLSDSALSEDGVHVILALPLQFPGGTIQSVAAQPISVQNDVTLSRSLGIVYPSIAFTKPTMVTVGMDFAPGQGIVAFSDSSVNPTTKVALAANGASGQASVSFWVLPGNKYKVTGSGTIISWIEWS